MKYSLVSIIVLNYNGKQYLKECLNSVRKLNYPKNRYEVIMGDNASSDDSVEYVKKSFPWVRVLQFNKNYGFAEGNNKCVEQAKGEYVVFLNNDTKVDRNWLIELVKGFDYDSEIAICGSKLLFYDRPDVINSSGGKISSLGGGCEVGIGKKDQAKFCDSKFVGYICGASLMIKKKIFEKLGRFDPDFFAYCEDTDLCWRAWLYGYKVFYTPDSFLFHKNGGSFKKTSTHFFVIRNTYSSVFKNCGITIPVFLVFNLLCYYILILKNLLFFNIKASDFSVNMILRAHLSFLKQIGKSLEKRRIIQKNRKLSDYELITNKNLFIKFWEFIHLMHSKI